MSKKEPDSPLVEAAQAVDRELESFSDLAAAFRRETFATQKSIDRGGQLLQQIAEADQRLGRALTDLVQAIGVARDEQAARAEAVTARARELQQRDATLRELLVRYQALGDVAARVNDAVRTLAASESASQQDAMASALPELIASIAKAADAGQEIAAAAEASGFADLARDAAGLRQQLLGAKNKMALLQKRP